jgi:hypothetical protein
MKKLFLLSAIAISGMFYNTANAQFRVHLGINLFPNRVVVAPRADVDAPVYADADYNANDDYYYLPDVGAYYNINEQCYYYFDGNNWISAAFLPGEYHDFDWRNARRYEVREPHPYLRNNFYVNRYRGNEYAFNRNNFHGDNHQEYGYTRNDGQYYNHQYQNNWNRNQQPVQNQYGQGRVNENNGWNNNRGDQHPAQNQDQDRNMWNNGGDRNNNHQQQPAQNQDNQNRGGEQRIAQNNQQRGGHGGGGWNRF